MSLQTDRIFIKTLSRDAQLMSAIGNRVYATAIPLPDEKLDNAPIPYVIVTFDGMRNDVETKDAGMEGFEDIVTVSVEVVAATIKALHELTAKVRTVLREGLETPDGEDSGEYPADYTLTASAIQYDPTKPCYWQTLTYQCVTNNN